MDCINCGDETNGGPLCDDCLMEVDNTAESGEVAGWGED